MIILNILTSDSYPSEKIEALSKAAEEMLEINLAQSRIEDIQVNYLCEALKGNETVTYLNLEHNRLTQEACVYLAKLLEENQTLKILNLSFNPNLESIGYKYLAKGLSQNASLKSLSLANNPSSSKGVGFILKSLELNNTLEYLNLEKASMDAENFQLLSDILTTNTSLSALNISRIQIPDKITEQLAQALSKNKTLKSLSITLRVYGPQLKFKYLINAILVANQTLLELSLPGSHLDDFSLKSLADALKTNASLSDLNLNFTNIVTAHDIASSSLEHFIACLEQNYSLERISLIEKKHVSYFSKIDPICHQKIEAILMRNKLRYEQLLPTDISLLPGISAIILEYYGISKEAQKANVLRAVQTPAQSSDTDLVLSSTPTDKPPSAIVKKSLVTRLCLALGSLCINMNQCVKNAVKSKVSKNIAALSQNESLDFDLPQMHYSEPKKILEENKSDDWKTEAPIEYKFDPKLPSLPMSETRRFSL